MSPSRVSPAALRCAETADWHERQQRAGCVSSQARQEADVRSLGLAAKGSYQRGT
jgi:hypothetical protein